MVSFLKLEWVWSCGSVCGCVSSLPTESQQSVRQKFPKNKPHLGFGEQNGSFHQMQGNISTNQLVYWK